MKNVLMKYLAALLVVWYSLSIIGFDVHSCTRTGEIFVASIAAGLSCEDIHPEHSCSVHGNCCGHCHSKGCCSHDDKDALSSEDCCQDDFHVLAFTGALSSKDHRFDQCASDYVAHPVECFVEIVLPTFPKDEFIRFKKPDSGITVPDTQALLNIWRI